MFNFRGGVLPYTVPKNSGRRKGIALILRKEEVGKGVNPNG